MTTATKDKTGIGRDEVIAILNEISDPCSMSLAFPIGLSDMGMVVGAEVEQLPSGRAEVSLQMRTTSPGCMYVPHFEQAVRAALGNRPEVDSVEITWTSPDDWSDEAMAPEARERLAVRRARLREVMKRRRRSG